MTLQGGLQRWTWLTALAVVLAGCNSATSGAPTASEQAMVASSTPNGGGTIPVKGANSVGPTASAPAQPAASGVCYPVVSEAVEWRNVVSCSVSATMLTKTGWNDGWTAGASSTRGLNFPYCSVDSDGYVEFTVPASAGIAMFGLSNGDDSVDYSDIDYAFYTYPPTGQLMVFENGAFQGQFGTYAAGDKLRVAVETGLVNYYWNGLLVHTSAAAPIFPLRVDTALYSIGAAVQDAVLVGEIVGVVPPWIPTPGDSDNFQWQNAIGIAIYGGMITKTSPTGWNNAGASSNVGLKQQGWGSADFTVPRTVGIAMFGLSNGDTDHDYSDIDYAFYTYPPTGQLMVFEKGEFRRQLGAYAPGDSLQLVYIFDTVQYRPVVNYYWNGLLVYTSALAPTLPLRVDTAIYSKGASVRLNYFGPNYSLVDVTNPPPREGVTWWNLINVREAGTGWLTKTAPTGWGWNAGASSTRGLSGAGDGYAEFKVVGDYPGIAMFGLSNGDDSVDYSDIDYAFYTYPPTGQLMVFEKGVFRVQMGPYGLGDTLRIAVEGGVVNYYWNDFLVYASTVAPTFPLRIDTALFSTDWILTSTLAGALVDLAPASLVPVSSVVATLASSNLYIGQTTQASAVPKDASGNVLTGRSITWSSSDPTLATVNASTGLVTAVKTGRAIITANCEGKAGAATVTAANTSGDVKVSVLSPTDGVTVGEALTVTASVTSTYQLTTVTALAAGTTVLMSYDPGGNGTKAWSGTLSLVGQPRGPVILIVKATDVFGNFTEVVVIVLLDRAPVVTVSAPFEGTVARPNATIEATCTDDDSTGCVSLTAAVNATTIASGKDSISQAVNLSAFEGQNIGLVITGVDSIGRRTTVTRRLFVESSTHLSVKAETSGTVWDASGSRVLFLDTSGATPALKVRDTATGTMQILETAPSGGYGFLTSTGAIYTHGTSVFPYTRVFEWRNGALSDLGGINSGTSLDVAGTYAIFNEAGDGGGTTTMVRRDLTAGTNVTISDSAGNTTNGVAPNGDVAYWTEGYFYPALGYNIYRWRGGTAQALTSDSPTTLWNTYPVTDGVNVVYRKHTPCCGTQTYRIAMHNGSVETVLTSASTAEPYPGDGYAVAGGYVAYRSQDIAGSLQIWRHSSRGEEQLTFFGSSSAINAIAPDGTILLTHNGRRFRATPNVALQDISSTLGRVVVRDGKFLVIVGGTVLEVGP